MELFFGSTPEVYHHQPGGELAPRVAARVNSVDAPQRFDELVRVGAQET